MHSRFCNMCNITLIQKLLIYFLSANHIDVIGIILFQFPVQLFHGMHDNRIFNLIRRIMCQHNIGAVFSGRPFGNSPTSFVPSRQLSRLLSRGKISDPSESVPEAHYFPNCPIFIYCCNDIHDFLPPDCYIATGMFLICGPVT